jgi:hypothetical protein
MAAEADIALGKHFGVSPATIATLRKEKLSKGTHWQTEGQTMNYTAAGEAELARLLDGVPPEKKEGGAEAEAELEPGNELLVLKCYPNPLWVRVRTPQGGECDLEVSSNKRLQPGFRLRCEPMPAETGGGWRCIHPGVQPRR